MAPVSAWRTAGYSALELLVTISIAAIVATFATPALTDFVVRSRLATQTNTLVGALHLARSEAVTRGQPVALCPSVSPFDTCADSSDWSTGWLVFTDATGTAGAFDGTDQLIGVFEAIEGSSLAAPTSLRSIRYLPDGFLATGGPAPAFRLVSIRGGSDADNVRTVCVSPQGRPSVSHGGSSC